MPPKLIIQLGRFIWTTLWRIMMSKLAPRDASGAYIRPESQFRDRIGSQTYPAASGRYKLFVGMSCPWAHRTLVTRALKGLENTIEKSIVSPSPENGGWILDQPEFGCTTLAELYRLAKPEYKERSTVPVLWDCETNTIVNNESSEIIVMLNREFNEFAAHPELDLYPDLLRDEIDRWNLKTYNSVNNGVYRCGFAQTQAAYESACNELFSMLDTIDKTLENNRYLCGDTLTLADIRLFTTLFRFDAAYYGIFKCSRRRIQDYENLGAYVRDIYQLPGVADTCDLQAVKRDYYGNLFPLNPGGIIPIDSDSQNLLAPHNRDKIYA
ncbi:glutathione S-transferase family protein [Leptolyngbya sp. NIES-2104]|uniref:glutathione S-transferase family protein n=1 Tax=Leptolyngbya sp. NIES-2104 TaxID=1552121 RepID=UPI0006EC7C20|nr:glutathione S-transferase family protein [Leptolyngbya sp. NIES-2104]GAP95612.1 glutathione S-transferase, omega [Leptolyngbya sp. NIES-2104]